MYTTPRPSPNRREERKCVFVCVSVVKKLACGGLEGAYVRAHGLPSCHVSATPDQHINATHRRVLFSRTPDYLARL
jgi:hypothetical protein